MKDLIFTLIGLIIGAVFGFLTSYLKEKGKNKALKSDIAKITEEKEKVKKEHELDIEKRKYKYESKQVQFTKFFNLLDELSVMSSQNVMNKFTPILSEYNLNFLEATTNDDKTMQNVVITKFQDDILELMKECNQYLIRLRTETNGLKLIANNEILSTLSILDKAYEIMFENSTNQIKLLANSIISNDTDALKKSMTEVDKDGKKILELRDQLMGEIRIELDRI